LSFRGECSSQALLAQEAVKLLLNLPDRRRVRLLAERGEPRLQLRQHTGLCGDLAEHLSARVLIPPALPVDEILDLLRRVYRACLAHRLASSISTVRASQIVFSRATCFLRSRNKTIAFETHSRADSNAAFPLDGVLNSA